MYIFKCILIFRRTASVLVACLLVCLSVGCASSSPPSFASKDGYVVLLPKGSSKIDIKWAKYLYAHMQKRSMKPQYIQYLEANDKMFGLGVSVVPTMENDFEIEREKSNLWLRAKNEGALIWLIYQLMERIGSEDSRIYTGDLPPHILTFSDSCGRIPFEYREPYLPENLVPEMAAIYGNHSVDIDWGLWGHNLRKALEDAPNSVFATVDGELNKSQFCFSSPDTYKSIEQFVIDQYGDGRQSPSRFSVFPDDNELVCTCASCIKIGNSPYSATPAVSSLVEKLAKRFPKHTFFTSSYLSTEAAPTYRLPDNVGAIVGAMDMPLIVNMEELPKSQKFIKRVEDWRKAVKNVYVWDYINNFDDYLTPFPILSLMQERLQLYRKIGVRGIFLNGSGYDYSTFSGLNTFALSALMKNPSYSVDSLFSAYFKCYYPVSAKALTTYYSQLEKCVVERGKRLNLYGCISDARRTHLDVSSFVKFYDSLSGLISGTKGEERSRLEALQVALTFTRLEIARQAALGPNGCATMQAGRLTIRPEMQQLLSLLGKAEHNKIMRYREERGEISRYIDEWKKYIMMASAPNSLLLKKIVVQEVTDDDHADWKVLTDGVRGLPNNYHQGWFISSKPELLLRLPVIQSRDARNLHLSFLHNPRHKIYAPQSVEVLKADKVIATFRPKEPKSEGDAQVLEVTGRIDGAGDEGLTLRVKGANKRKAQIACDEIQLNP